MLIVFTDKKTDSDLFIKLSIGEYCNLYGIPLLNYDIIRKEDEKPYLSKNHLFFNLSHSADITVCAVSNKEIGIDVQFHKDNIDAKAISLKFTGAEFIGKEFFDYYAKAEAVSKLYGKNNLFFYLRKNNDNVKIIPFFENYSLAIASSDSKILLTEYRFENKL